MAFPKTTLLDKAVEIVKSYARSGGSIHLDAVLRMVYTELVKINDEIETQTRWTSYSNNL